VLACSAQTGEGVEEVWKAVTRFTGQARARGEFSRRRRAQELSSLQGLVEEGLHELLGTNPFVRAERSEVTRLVAAGELTPAAGARRLIRSLGQIGHKKNE
jgi:LAO/AO transport system kinase